VATKNIDYFGKDFSINYEIVNNDKKDVGSIFYLNLKGVKWQQKI